jgi:hypothetical protein
MNTILNGLQILVNAWNGYLLIQTIQDKRGTLKSGLTLKKMKSLLSVSDAFVLHYSKYGTTNKSVSWYCLL